MRCIYDHELILFAGADFEVEIEDKKFLCPANSFIIVPPARHHFSQVVSGRRGHRFWIHFDWILTDENPGTPLICYHPAVPDPNFFRHPPSFAPSPILHGPIADMRATRELFERIETLFNKGSGKDRLLCRALFLRLLLELLIPDGHVGEREPTVSKLATTIRSRLRLLADMSPNKYQSLQDYLEKSGVSYAHQARVFKASYGISPLQYVTELRMSRVKLLLKNTDAPIANVATEAGFEDLAYFSRVFKKSTGVSPRAYRALDRVTGDTSASRSNFSAP